MRLDGSHTRFDGRPARGGFQGFRGLRERRRAEWEARWSSADFDPPWGGRGVPGEVEEAIQSGWHPASGRMLDVGCGEGDLVDWFSGHGYQGVGIDIAGVVISKARARHDRSGGPRFATVDICSAVPPGGPFDVIVDRGCLHGIPRRLVPCYVANLAAACHAGTRMFLFMRIRRRQGRFWRLSVVRTLELWLQRRRVARDFRGLFAVQGDSMTDLGGPSACEAMPGVVYRLARKPVHG